MKNSRAYVGQGGFSLIELVTVLVVMGIILAIAMPMFSEIVVSTRMTSQANDLMADILYARSEASARGVRVSICPTADQISCSATQTDWNQGRIIFADSNGNSLLDAGEALNTRSALSGQSALTPSGFSNLLLVTFNPYGGVVPLGTTGAYKLCPPSSPYGRQIAVEISGRPAVTRISTCP